MIRFFLWFTATLFLGVTLVAWISFQLQLAGLAPIGLLSLAVGGVLGGIGAVLLRLVEFGNRRAALAGMLIAAFATAAAQHVFAYRHYQANFQAAIESNPKAALARAFNPEFGPGSFGEFMEASGRQEGAIFRWGLDAGLIVVASLAVVWLSSRSPYCTTCRSWYRTKQRGELSSSDQLRQVATAAGQALLTGPASGRYRLRSCLRECGPAELQLTWTGGSIDVWLSPEQRTAVEEFLREQATKQNEERNLQND